MEQQIKKGDYLLLLPSAIPITILFILPLLYSLSLIFTTPVYDELGKEIYSDSNYEYHYKGEINRYRQYNPETNEYTGNDLRPYDIKSRSEIYKQVKTWGFQNIKTFFMTKRYRVTILNTFRLVIPASLVQFLLAFSMAYYLRKKIRGKFFLTTMIIFPLTLGSLIIASGMTNLFRTSGWFNLFLLKVGLIENPIVILYTYWGTFIAITIGGTAFLFSGFLAICEQFDPNLEVAALTLGANRFKTFLLIFLPLTMPSLLGIFSLGTVLMLGLYPSAVLVGDPVNTTRVFAVAAFEEFQQAFNYNMAATVSLVLTLSQVVVLIVLGRIRRLFYIGFGGTFK